MKIRLITVLTAALVAWPWAAAEAETLREMFKKVDGAVIVIQTNYRDVVTGSDKRLTSLPGMGSGVLISADGKVMAAAHLVQTADEVVALFETGELVTASASSGRETRPRSPCSGAVRKRNWS